MAINEVLMQYEAEEFGRTANNAELGYSANEKAAKMLNVFFKISNKLRVNGIENLDGLKDSPYVIIANHESWLDYAYLSSALKGHKKIRWINRAEVFEKNEALVIFPKRIKKKSDELLDFYGRAARICIENDAPYVPVAIVGDAKPFMRRVTLNIGRPVYLRKISADHDDYKLISIDMKCQISELLRGNFGFFPALYEK
jgi:1-acyl-sn-glycerol-3-phosphate acyltransferase